ncbi:hypothetical protein QC761_511380 [Podospora bellae-mahoneyi]|uniref:Uncharacterized protein n=1 Tax=Podospora bellae-mahoneyi TaxID=2093777 RepID=A0ABR0FF75_9PEZI|nr:hypothetical protein QC761_511380 [Podospora bellae-mahoneyi]
MPPKKEKALIKKATPKGRLKASSTESTKDKATATTSTKKTHAASKASKDNDDGLVKFPQFKRFPLEIQQEIFTQALRKPSIHFMNVEKAVIPGYTNDKGNWVDPTWHLTYYPKPKSTDGSGYRINKDMGSVSRAAQQAVILATKNPGNLPFSRAWGPMDTNHDLVVLDFLAGATSNPKSDFRYFHVNNQFFVPYFDPELSFPAGRSRLRDEGEMNKKSVFGTETPGGMADLKKVGVVYKQSSERTCAKQNTVFQCCIHVDGSIVPHGDWTMCPDEVAGFIDSMPGLEVLYFVVQVPKGSREDRERLEIYRRWFSTTYHEQRRIKGQPEDWLTLFHDADKTYIGVDRFLMLPSDEARRMDLDVVREVRELIKEVHRQLTQDKDATPMDLRRIFRTPLGKRQAMAYKILLPVSGI